MVFWTVKNYGQVRGLVAVAMVWTMMVYGQVRGLATMMVYGRVRGLMVLALALSVFVASDVVAEECAEGMTTRTAAVLYDGPSARAGELLILSASYPLRRLGDVSGWCKVLLPSGENGWVRARVVRGLRAAMAVRGGAVVRADPEGSAPGVFFARDGVVMEVLGRARPGWWQVLHADGETGYVGAGEVWVNF